jgi:amino acid transporter
VLLIYGFLFMAVIASCIAVSLGELASAYPNSGNPPLPPPDPLRNGILRTGVSGIELIVGRGTVLLG